MGVHNVSEVSTRARTAPEEGKGVGGGIPLRRCGKIFKSKTLKYTFSAALYLFTALLPCFTTILKKLITSQSLLLNYTIVNISQHQLNMLDDKN